MTADFSIKKGDTRPSISAILSDDVGPVNITGASVKFHMKLRGSPVAEAPKVNAAATIVSGAAGSVRYDWVAADTDTAGIYEGEWEVDFGAGLKMTFPNWRNLEILVREDVD